VDVEPYAQEEIALCCAPMGCIAGAAVGLFLGSLIFNPQVNKHVSKSPDRYLDAFPRIAPYSFYFYPIPQKVLD
jgi:hypothetical protein